MLLAVSQSLGALNQFPDFNNYLAFVFTRLKSESEPTRAVAGLVLKNNVRLYYDKFPEETQVYVKQESLSVVTDESPIIRATAGTLVSTIALCGQLVKWPELLPSLCQLIDNSEQKACEVREGERERVREGEKGRERVKEGEKGRGERVGERQHGG